MNKHKEARITQRVREFERRHQAFDGAYGADRPVKWFAFVGSGGIGAASESDATIDLGGTEGPITIMDGTEPVQARTPAQGSGKLYYVDDDAVLQPLVDWDGSAWVTVTATIYNYAKKAIGGPAMTRVENVGGFFFVISAECPPDPPA